MQGINYLSPLEFRVTVDRLPSTTFHTQKVTIPGLSANAIAQPTAFNPTYHAGDNLTYDTFTLNFIIDESMNNWMEIHDWLVNLTFPKEFQQFVNVKESEYGLFSDIAVTILNSKKNPNIQINLRNCFPVTLSQLDLDTTQSTTTYPEATATFAYDYYEIKRV